MCCLHSVGIALGREVDPHGLFFFNSIGGLILDKTVTDPNFEGMAVFTPVINGRLGRGIICMLLFIPPLLPKGYGIHCCPCTEVCVQVPAPIMSGSEATGPHYIPTCILKCLWSKIQAGLKNTGRAVGKVNSI